MITVFQNLLAERDSQGWEQLIILAIVFGFAILKKIFSVVKENAASQSQRTEQRPAQQQKPHPVTKRSYAGTAFKTLEELRQEKIEQIRAAYGITEPSPQVREESHEQPPSHTQKKKIKKPALPQAAYKPQYIKQQASPPRHIKPKHTEQQKSVETIVSLATPEDLRSAILYQEILGKPLALRE